MTRTRSLPPCPATSPHDSIANSKGTAVHPIGHQSSLAVPPDPEFCLDINSSIHSSSSLQPPTLLLPTPHHVSHLLPPVRQPLLQRSVYYQHRPFHRRKMGRRFLGNLHRVRYPLPQLTFARQTHPTPLFPIASSTLLPENSCVKSLRVLPRTSTLPSPRPKRPLTPSGVLAVPPASVADSSTNSLTSWSPVSMNSALSRLWTTVRCLYLIIFRRPRY